MKKLCIIGIIVLMMCIAAAAQEIGGITAPKGVKADEKAAAEKKEPAKYYYVVGPNSYTTTVQGKEVTLSPGQTFFSATEVEDDRIFPISETQKNFADKYAGKYEYTSPDTFTYSKESFGSSAFEEYKTETTVSMTTENGVVIQKYEEQSFVCGKGVTACEKDPTGEKKWEPQPGSHNIVTFRLEEKTITVRDEEVTRTVLTSKTEVIAFDAAGNPSSVFTTTYAPTADDPAVVEPSTVAITNADGTDVYFKTSVDPDTGETIIDVNEIDRALSEGKMSKEEADAARVMAVESGNLGLKGAWNTLTFTQKLGRAMRAFEEYRGLRQLSSLFWPEYAQDVQERRQAIQQEFCLFAGITNCFTSIICGSIYDLESDNILVGKGPTGQYVSSASLNAQRSQPIEIEGLTRQQLRDLFGNTTVIAGRLIDLTDPDFDPKELPRIKLRLYHVQFSITNNARGEEDLRYNVVFRRVPQEFNSSYGTPVRSARWYPQDKVIDYLKTARDELYKYSGTEYNSVCLTFDPELPSGHAAFSELVDDLCVPFVEYAGGPTEVGAPGAAAPPEGTTSDTPTSQIPGGLI